MVDTWIVFGGWALRPKILLPLFGPGAALIDTNELMPDLVRNGSLVKNWTDVLAGHVLPLIPDRPFGIAGWSTGSLLAYALAQRVSPACGAFISATPSFCRRPGFPHGWKPSTLTSMRRELSTDPRKVLAQVYRQCGGNSGDFGPEVTAEYALERLTAGLLFLEQANLLPVEHLPFPALFLHGRADSIIPAGAGRYFSDAAGGTFIDFDGPHAFFTNQYHEISRSIGNHFKSYCS
jgi:surfactin synthase thioesterase subunit